MSGSGSDSSLSLSLLEEAPFVFLVVLTINSLGETLPLGVRFP